MFINKKTGASYGFVAPEISEDAGKDIKVPFPTFGGVEAKKVEDHLEVNVNRTHTVVTFGEIDKLPIVDLKTSMIGEIPIIKLVAKPNAGLSDGIRLTVMLDSNSDLYPQTRLEDDPVDDKKNVKIGLVALVLSASDEPEAPAFVCVVPSVASFLSETLNKLMGDDSKVEFRGNPVPVHFFLMSGQWVPDETIVGLASVQTTVDGVSELVDRITDAIANNDNSGEDDPTDNEGGGNDDPTDNEGSGNDAPAGNEGSGNDAPPGNESGGNDDPTGNEGGDNDDPNNGGDH